MVVTILEAHVTPENWAVLEQEYKAGIAQLPPQLVQTFLIHGSADPRLWRIVSVWRSGEALEEMRRSPKTPAGILMFRAAGVEPTLSVFDVSAQASEAGQVR